MDCRGRAQMTSWIAYLIVFALFLLVLSQAMASDDHQTIKTEYVYLSKDNESAKYVLGGAVLTCLILSVWKGRWCWEEKTMKPVTQ